MTLKPFIISLSSLNSKGKVTHSWIQSEYRPKKLSFISSTSSYWSTEKPRNPWFLFIDKHSWLSGISSFSKEMWNNTKLFLMSSKRLLTFQNSWLSERVFVSVCVLPSLNFRISLFNTWATIFVVRGIPVDKRRKLKENL